MGPEDPHSESCECNGDFSSNYECEFRAEGNHRGTYILRS